MIVPCVISSEMRVMVDEQWIVMPVMGDAEVVVVMMVMIVVVVRWW